MYRLLFIILTLISINGYSQVIIQSRPIYIQRPPIYYIEQQPVYIEQQPVYIEREPVYIEQVPVDEFGQSKCTYSSTFTEYGYETRSRLKCVDQW